MKDPNPKDAVGVKKVPMSCIPVPVLMELGVAMQEGALKYGRHNYRCAPVRASIYYDAFWRHIGAWWEGEDIDVESGLSHITKAIAGLVVLRDAMQQKMLVDDRPPRSYGWLPMLNERSADLLKKYPNPVKPYTEVTFEDGE